MHFDSLLLPATILGFATLGVTAQESGLDGRDLSTGEPELFARGGTSEESDLWTRHRDGGNRGDTSRGGGSRGGGHHSGRKRDLEARHRDGGNRGDTSRGGSSKGGYHGGRR